MIKRFAYIVLLLLIFAPCLSFAKTNIRQFKAVTGNLLPIATVDDMQKDTAAKNVKKQEPEDKKKIKEVAKAKKQPKPEKVESGDNQTNTKSKQRPKRQRRPEGLERPPEIPRRNGN